MVTWCFRRLQKTEWGDKERFLSIAQDWRLSRYSGWSEVVFNLRFGLRVLAGGNVSGRHGKDGVRYNQGAVRVSSAKFRALQRCQLFLTFDWNGFARSLLEDVFGLHRRRDYLRARFRHTSEKATRSLRQVGGGRTEAGSQEVSPVKEGGCFSWTPGFSGGDSHGP